MTQTLNPGFHDVPPGHVATIVTHLEMTTPPPPRAVPRSTAQLIPLRDANAETYRDLFRAVGQEWLWFSRLGFSDAELADLLAHPDYDAFALRNGDTDLGLLELDFREEGACELAFFGLTSPAIGTGLGRWLMAQAIARAYARPIRRFHVHTCTLDSPQALAFYIRSGFTPVRQQVEIAPDPRLNGTLPATCGAHVPMFPA